MLKHNTIGFTSSVSFLETKLPKVFLDWLGDFCLDLIEQHWFFHFISRLLIRAVLRIHFAVTIVNSDRVLLQVADLYQQLAKEVGEPDGLIADAGRSNQLGLKVFVV